MVKNSKNKELNPIFLILFYVISSGMAVIFLINFFSIDIIKLLLTLRLINTRVFVGFIEPIVLLGSIGWGVLVFFIGIIFLAKKVKRIHLFLPIWQIIFLLHPFLSNQREFIIVAILINLFVVIGYTVYVYFSGYLKIKSKKKDKSHKRKGKSQINLGWKKVIIILIGLVIISTIYSFFTISMSKAESLAFGKVLSEAKKMGASDYQLEEFERGITFPNTYKKNGVWYVTLGSTLTDNTRIVKVYSKNNIVLPDNMY
jgi:hypothetical protein